MANQVLLDTIRDGYGRVAYTHKTHEKQIELLGTSLSRLKWAQIISMVLTTCGTLSFIIVNTRGFEIATALLAAISLGIVIYGWAIAPEKEIFRHRICAKQLWHIRERYLNLLTDMKTGVVSDEEAASRRDALVDQLDVIYQNAPDTSPKAYGRATRALKVSEELTLSDKEIDDLLPHSLRKIGS